MYKTSHFSYGESEKFSKSEKAKTSPSLPVTTAVTTSNLMNEYIKAKFYNRCGRNEQLWHFQYADLVKHPAEEVRLNNSNVSLASWETAGASWKIKNWWASSMHICTNTLIQWSTETDVGERNPDASSCFSKQPLTADNICKTR